MGEEPWPVGISTVRLKGGKPWCLGPQAQADLQERGGWRAGGQPLWTHLSHRALHRSTVESVKPATPLAECSEGPAEAFPQVPSPGHPVTVLVVSVLPESEKGLFLKVSGKVFSPSPS